MYEITGGHVFLEGDPVKSIASLRFFMKEDDAESVLEKLIEGIHTCDAEESEG